MRKKNEGRLLEKIPFLENPSVHAQCTKTLKTHMFHPYLSKIMELIRAFRAKLGFARNCAKISNEFLKFRTRK